MERIPPRDRSEEPVRDVEEADPGVLAELLDRLGEAIPDGPDGEETG